MLGLIRKDTEQTQGVVGEDNAVIQGLVEASLSPNGAASDQLAEASN